MTTAARPVPQSTSHARTCSPSNVPSMRGRLNASSMVPVNSPDPPTGTAPVGDPNAVMIPASSRSLSCQSVLATWNGMRDRSPYAVRPSKVTVVADVDTRPESMSTHSGSKR